MTRSLNRRSGVLFAAAAVLGMVLCVGAPEVAEAQGEPTRMEFVGFGKNDTFAVVMKDEMAGDSVLFYKVGEAVPKAVYPLDDKKLKKALKDKALKKEYDIQTEGAVEGETAPKGYKLFVRQAEDDQASAKIMVGLGDAESTIGTTPVAADPMGSGYATVTVKKVYWTADNALVVVILNQKLDGDWPIDSDTVVAFDLRPKPKKEEAPK